MIDIAAWQSTFLQVLEDTFPQRVWFVGLQGSYARGEASETSDIDMVVILDRLSVSDIEAYRSMLDTLPHRELICGFLSSRDEILNWEASDLFQFYHDTTPIKGSLDKLLPLLDKAAVTKAIKTGVCTVYHGCIHNMLHEKSDEVLRCLYKSASFVVQAIYFQETGRYIRTQNALLNAISPDEQSIIGTFLHLKQGGTVQFREMSAALFDWAQKWINKI